uniref:RNase H type-1 domain-containing protein n=1 Tax=Oryza sativa subsp. japonica TaxID=39947 RepID=Q6Z807_ORYSJ|nr:hypothetical protein [Oryza sativa Japonica Group]
MKLNVDGSFDPNYENGGIGAILKDERGTVIFSSCRFFERCYDALEMELLACKEEIVFGDSWTLKLIVVESDCLEAKVHCGQDCASHILANKARCEEVSNLWLEDEETTQKRRGQTAEEGNKAHMARGRPVLTLEAPRAACRVLVLVWQPAPASPAQRHCANGIGIDIDNSL